MAARLATYLVVAIVAGTLIAGLIVGAQRDDSSGPVDLIVHNGVVYTADDFGSTAEAVAVRGNTILRVGSNREIMRLRRPQTRVIDARGAAVLPGFDDAHARFIAGGLSAAGVDLVGARTVIDMQQRLQEWADVHPDEPSIIGHGWIYEPFADGLPERQQIDVIIDDRPVLLVSQDGHAVWANSKALQLAGISKRTAAPANGVIVKDGRGEPTGVLKDTAMALVSRLAPSPTREERARALRAAMHLANERGVTSVQDIGAAPGDLELYDEAKREGVLAVRVYAVLPVRAPLTTAEADHLDAVWKQYSDDPLLKTGAIDVPVDGGIGLQTAAMLEPYAGRTTDGMTRIPVADLNRLVTALDARGWQVTADASGDRAVRMALDAYALAARKNPAPSRGRRHRVEGAEVIDQDDLPRFSALGVIAAMQPFHGNPDVVDVWGRSLGPDRGSRGWAAHSLSATHARLAFGTDWPSLPLNPMLALHTAVTRTSPEGTPEEGWYPEEKLTLKSAIDAFTSSAAWASFDEHRKGTLKAGMLADLVVLSQDIFSAPAASLASTTVAVTIFDGRVVYQRDAHKSAN